MTDQTKPKRKRGRPKGQPGASKWTPEIEDRICALFATGMSLRETCRQDGVPLTAKAVLDRIVENSDFHKRYTRARELGYALQFEEMREIAASCPPANGDVQKAKLMIDVIKWQLSKALPRIYGDKLSLEHSGEVQHGASDVDRRDLARTISEILAEGGDIGEDDRATKH